MNSSRIRGGAAPVDRARFLFSKYLSAPLLIYCPLWYIVLGSRNALHFLLNCVPLPLLFRFEHWLPCNTYNVLVLTPFVWKKIVIRHDNYIVNIVIIYYKYIYGIANLLHITAVHYQLSSSLFANRRSKYTRIPRHQAASFTRLIYCHWF